MSDAQDTASRIRLAPSCARSCSILGQHTQHCGCTNECPEHDKHCKGCLPQPAVVGHYCQRCTDRFRDALKAIPELVVRVASSPDGTIMRKQVAGDMSRKATKVDQMSPSPAWDTADEVILWAAAWADTISRGQADPARYNVAGLPVRDLTRSVSYLLNRLTQVLTEDYHPDLYAETVSMHRGLINATGLDNVTRRITDPCPTCDRRTLVRDDVMGTVTCRNRDCGRLWRPGEWEQRVPVAS